MIDSMKLGPDNWSMDPFVIKSSFINHFRTIYTSSNPQIPKQLENLFEKQILNQDNALLCAVPSEEEIFGALKQIPNHKVSSSDGMTALFYRHY